MSAETAGDHDLPTCPGCDEQIGPGEIQHRGVVARDGETWHRPCLYDHLGRRNVETGRMCPRCRAVSTWLPEVTGPTTKRLCPGCGRVFDGPVVETEADR